MGSDYYSLEETAEILKIATAELNRLRERGELRAFRDGMNWKFRKKDIHDYYAKVKGQSQTPSGSDSDALDSGEVANNKPTPVDTDPFDALVEDGIAESELVVAPGSSGMLAKKDNAKPAEDVLSLAADDFLTSEDDGLTLAKDDELVIAKNEKNAKSELKLEENDDLSLAKDDDDLSLDDDGLTLANDDLSLAKDDELSIAKDNSLSLSNGYGSKKPKEELVLGTGSALDLSALEDDDDEVLSLNAAKNGGKTSGDGLSLEDDSGLSLLDMEDEPAPEKPITLAKRKSDSDIGLDSLELDEDDDIISIANDDYDIAGEEEATTDKSPSDGDFDLEPAFTAFDDDSDSASQAIALEGSASTEMPAFDGFGGGAADSFGGFGDATAPPAGQPVSAATQATPFGGGDGAALSAAFPTTTAPTYTGPSEPAYGTGMVVTSVICVGFLGLGVMMLFDVILNMWSWGNTFPVNSLILDTLKGMVF